MSKNVFWRISPVVAKIKREWGMHPSDAIGMLRAEGYRWNDVKEMLGISEGSMNKYLREEDKGYYNLTPEGRKGQRRNARFLNEKMRRGLVERGGFAKVPLRMVNPGSIDSCSNL